MWFFVPSMAGFVASPSGIMFFVPTWHGCSDYRRCGWELLLSLMPKYTDLPILSLMPKTTIPAVTFFDAKESNQRLHVLAVTFFDAKESNQRKAPRIARKPAVNSSL
jgi:hypothetical protein